MAPSGVASGDEDNENASRISTFAVLDLETSNLPEYYYNRVSTTELSIYAFDSALLKEKSTPNLEEQTPSGPPAFPRVVHKLNLLFRPSRAIDPTGERLTGLSNYLLERESPWNQNAGNLILSFLEHLPAPVCLVAHNGWHFDYPIVRQAFDKLGINLPESLLCVDSLRAFMEIDDKRGSEQHIPVINSALEIDVTEPDPETQTETSKNIDWQKVNETTPSRPTISSAEAAQKRKLLNDNDDGNEDNKRTRSEPSTLKARRQLFAGPKCAETKRFPVRGLYKLSNLYQRVFQQPAINAHQAESDVKMLTNLIQHYGVDFLAFAEEQAIPFADVVPLGQKKSFSK